MRVLFLRVGALVAVLLTVITSPVTRVSAQEPPPRVVVLAPPPEIHTKIEALLATPNAVLTTDYYRIDMRFGPGVRIDAVVVTEIESQTRVRGLRVQVHADDPHGGVSFLDLEEVANLSRALTSMSDLAAKWTGRDDRRATDLSFASASGFRVDIHEAGRLQKVVLTTGVRDPTSLSIDIQDLPGLRQAIDQALALLNSQ